MKLLVFQHLACEHPGVFRHFLEKNRINWHTVKLDEGDHIPKLESFDALWVMGGPMDVWELRNTLGSWSRKLPFAAG